MAKILDRIGKIAQNEGISIGALERNIGASKGVLSRALANGTDIQTKWLSVLVENYPQYSPEWLLTGRGEMLKSSTSETVTPDAQPEPKVTTDPAEGKPYFDVDFLGGFHEIFNDQTNLPALRIIVPGFEKAYLWCNVTGHSMEPRISHGDIIALRQCSIDDIQYGEIYAVVLDSIRTIKILRRGPSPDTLLFVPINKPDFEDQPFPIARIIRIFEVIGSISKFF